MLKSDQANPRALTPKQQRFVQEYLQDLNATQAAIRVGYSKHTANEQGARLLAKVSAIVQPLLAAQQEELAKKSAITRERWLLEIQRCAFFDPRKLFDTHGNPIEVCQLDDESAPVVAGFEFTEEFIGKKNENRTACGYTKKFKLVDKLKALEVFGKAVGYHNNDEPTCGDLQREITVRFVRRLQSGEFACAAGSSTII